MHCDWRINPRSRCWRARTTTLSIHPAIFQIASHEVGAGRAFLIAEVAQAHDGSLGLAHAFIDAAAEAGADAVKFQTHIAAAESTLDEPFRVRFSHQDDTRYAYWKRMEFSAEQWAGLAGHAREKGLVFLSSAFSVPAVELLARLGMPAWKIASGELSSTAILTAMERAGGPFLLSTGMSGWAEIDALTTRIRGAGRSLAILQCTSRYPTPLEAVGLNVIDEIRQRYGVPAGLSDHSGQVYPAIAAIARGAAVVELHLTLDRHMFGPDVPASLTVDEFRLVSGFRNALAVMDASAVDKDAVAEELAQMRATFRRSLAPARPLSAGTILAPEMLTAKKPGTGIPEDQLTVLIGRRLRRDVAPDRLLHADDIED
jgi:N,N'-diacetyllegionaminate synthase